MPFRGAGLVAPASRQQFCAAAGVQKIAGGTPALPNPNLDDEARDHRTDPSNRREKPRLNPLPVAYHRLRTTCRADPVYTNAIRSNHPVDVNQATVSSA